MLCTFDINIQGAKQIHLKCFIYFIINMLKIIMTKNVKLFICSSECNEHPCHFLFLKKLKCILFSEP